MGVVVIAAAGVSACAMYLYLTQGDQLIEDHARLRADMLNALRWGAVVLLSWALIPLAYLSADSQPVATIIEMTTLIAALMLLPVRWFALLGGRDVKWDLRRVKVELTRMSNRIRAGAGQVQIARIRDDRGLIEGLRTPETSPLCDLMIAELEDLLSGFESWNEAGRRAIRMDELSRTLWPGAVPPPDFDPDEATFRWRLYRAFGRLMEIGVVGVSPAAREEFAGLLASLESYRRSDTGVFIDEVKKSGDSWLADPLAARPWIESYDFSVLGPDGLDNVRRIWGRDAALWGAQLEEEDLQAVEADRVRRGKTIEPAARRSSAPGLAQ